MVATTFLTTLLSVGVALGSSKTTPVFKNDNFEIYKVSSRNYFIKTASGKTPTVGSHSGVVVADNDVIVIDSHLTPEIEKAVSTQMKKITGKNPTIVINSHYHDDHTGGNSYYAKSAKILAHNSTVQQLKDKKVKPSEIQDHDIDQLKRQNIQIITVGHGHSEGDIVLFDTKDKVLYTGDLFVNGYIGYLGEASFKTWIPALQKLEDLKASIVVPGHGALAQTSDITFFRQYLIDFARSTKSHFEKGGSIETYALPEKYKDLGAQFYLEENVEHAYELWKKGELTGI